jgi:hypothetical protein
MPVTGFFNDNANRSYPFVSDLSSGYAKLGEISSSSGDSWSSISSSAGYALPSNVIVDFGCVLGVESTYVEGVDSVYLYGVARIGDFLWFEFRCTNAAMASHNLFFGRKIDDAENTIEYVDASPQGIPGSNFPTSLSFPDVVEERMCETRPVWEGYLVTGDLTELAALLNSTGDTWYAGDIDSTGATDLKIEPALIQNLGKSYLRSANLANETRTHTTPYESCSSSESLSSGAFAPIDYGDSSSDYVVNATCLDGALVFREGYNCHITQSRFDNSLSFSAGSGSGDGEPCDEVSLFSSESAPADSKFLSGGPSCFDLLTSINGVFGSGLTPSVLSLIAGPGIRIKPTAGVPHSIDVIFDLRDFTVCIAPPSESSQSLPPEDGSSSSSSSLSSGSSPSTESSSSSSLSESIEGCEDCSECDSQGYAIFVQDEWTHSKPFIPDTDTILGSCGPCWNNCCDGYVPPEVGSLDMHDAADPFLCGPHEIADMHIAKFCCEEAPPSSCSACDGDPKGWVLWYTDINQAGYPNNKRWEKWPEPWTGPGAYPECCPGYEEVIPTPDADPNYLPPFTTLPEYKFRKECCEFTEQGFSAGVGTYMDFHYSCPDGWCWWAKSPQSSPGPWDLGNCMREPGQAHGDGSLYSCGAGYSSAMPAYTDWDGTVVTGAVVVGSIGWGIDSIYVATCCS